MPDTMPPSKLPIFVGIFLLLAVFQVLAQDSFTMDLEDVTDDDESDEAADAVPYIVRFKAKAEAAIDKLVPARESLSTLTFESTFDVDPLFLEYGVHSEMLEQPLMVGPEKILHYKVLVNTPNGRHLLMISLLEHPSGDIWNGKCMGKLKMFLPDKLKSPMQPPLPPDALLLEEIMSKGQAVLREEVMDKFNLLVPKDLKNEIFSWFKEDHRNAVNSLVDWVLDHETFGSCFSLLATIRERLSKHMFVELVNLVIAGRKDTGFVMPSIESYMPEDFFPPEFLTPYYGTSNIEETSGGVELPETRINEVVGVRVARQAEVVVWTRTNWNESEWYFREDPVANSHHIEWHRSAGRPFNRWGEYFYYMHNQMLARYEAERISLGLGLLAEYFGPEQWTRMIPDSYDPKLGQWSWTPRQPGMIDSFYVEYLSWALDGLLTQVLETAPTGYVRGVDRGINDIGARMENGVHNMGHVFLAMVNGGYGVMGSPRTAMRDPIFYRWHGFVDSVLKDYKNMLSPYSEAGLSFPGVASVAASVQSQGGAKNTFYTYREIAEVKLNRLDSTSPGTRLSLQYRRMNHLPFTWNIVINSYLAVRTPAIVRIFMMPTNGADNKATLHMDHFFMYLNFGENRITREELEAPHLSKSRWSLSKLQDSLMNGQVSREEFSWGGCGWPRHLNIPRGTERGMDWTMVVMVSQVLSEDIPKIEAWSANSNIAWSYCGVTTGVVPDSRPLGFPVDRDFGDIESLVGYRNNWAVVPVRIVHVDGNTTSA